MVDMKVLWVVLLLACDSLAAPGKIVGGQPADITEVAYQLQLQEHEIVYWTLICGATIIAPNVALTAAHCISGLRIRFLSGSTNRGEGTMHHGKQTIVHPQWGDGFDYDVAVVIVEEPFEDSPTTRIVPLTETEPQAGDIATISGWGALKEGSLGLPDHLQKVDIPIVDRVTCQEGYPRNDITDRMICAGLPEGGKDSCQGDSGGPLVVNGSLAGIVSWGEGCAKPGKAGVYTNVANVRGWILEQVQAAAKYL